MQDQNNWQNSGYLLETQLLFLDYFRSGRGNSESLMAGASGFDPVLTAEKNKILKLVKSF